MKKREIFQRKLQQAGCCKHPYFRLVCTFQQSSITCLLRKDYEYSRPSRHQHFGIA